MSEAKVTFDEWLETQFAETPGVLARDIAKTAKISPGYISGLRKRRRANPSPVIAERIAAAFAARRGLEAGAVEELKRSARQAAAISSASQQSEAMGSSRSGWSALGAAWERALR